MGRNTGKQEVGVSSVIVDSYVWKQFKNYDKTNTELGIISVIENMNQTG